MDKLTVLDIGRLRGITKNFIRRISNGMPNLEVLNMEGTVPVDVECLYEIFADDAFRCLKELILAFVQLTDSVMAKLVKWKRPLKVLNIDGSFPLHDSWLEEVNLSSAQFAETLERFYANGFMRETTVFTNVAHFQNLTLLSLSYCPEASDDEFLTIKNLRQLEHLHLTGQCSWLRTASIIHLFTVPRNDPYAFPCRLKFLCFSHFYDLNDDAIGQITHSCSRLEALNVSRSDSLTSVGMRMILGRLRHLRYLDVSHNNCFDKEIVGMMGRSVPELRFLVAHGCQNIDVNDMIAFTEQRNDHILVSLGRCNIIGSAAILQQTNEDIVIRILDKLRQIDGFCCITDIMKPFL